VGGRCAIRTPPVDASPLVVALHVDVTSLRRLKNIARWIGGDPLLIPFGAGIAATITRDVLVTAYEYLNLAFLLDGTGVYAGARLLRAHDRALLGAIVAIGDIDVAISTASFRAGQHEWTRPRFGEPPATVQLTNIRHPLLEQAVPNSVSLAPGRGLLITGSNMSGKSTLLRAVGVTVVMAQTLNTCLASAYDAPTLDVRSCIGRSDDLLSGTSYYVAEVRSLLGLVQASESAAPHLFLLDELFRGTNAVERIAAGRAVLLESISGATRPSPHVVLAATHDGELVDLLPDTYAPCHFGDAVSDDGLVFDHRMRPGPATTRNAIALLRIHGAPNALISRASECASMLDAQRGATLHGR
jgi:DNA mismatch repair ATPase MutS